MLQPEFGISNHPQITQIKRIKPDAEITMHQKDAPHGRLTYILYNSGIRAHPCHPWFQLPDLGSAFSAVMRLRRTCRLSRLCVSALKKSANLDLGSERLRHNALRSTRATTGPDLTQRKLGQVVRRSTSTSAPLAAWQAALLVRVNKVTH
jgi:hypothetical protein